MYLCVSRNCIVCFTSHSGKARYGVQDVRCHFRSGCAFEETQLVLRLFEDVLPVLNVSSGRGPRFPGW